MKKLKKLLSVLGPGFITGASDDDPTAIAAYTQAGAQFGYHQLWTALFTFPFMTVIQEMCGRIGMVTGKGLSGVIKRHYSKEILYAAVMLLLVANTINIGADLGAMASSAQLLVGIPYIFWLVGLTVLTLLLEVFVSYPKYARFLKFLTITFLSYVVVAFIVKQNWRQVALSTFIPYISFNKVYLLNLVAILGTNISPYLFFWQADEEVEEEVEHHAIQGMGRGVPKVTRKDFRLLRLDTTVGMLFSNVIVFFICLTAASTLGAYGITNIETPTQAAEALRPLAGDLSFALFAIGILGSGMLAVPILAGSAAYALSEVFNWKEGLSKKFSQAHGFYGIITVATLIGLLINFTSLSPFKLLYYSAALNGILAVPLLIFILLVANNKTVMGEHTNSHTSNILGIIITCFMALAAGALIFNIFVK